MLLFLEKHVIVWLLFMRAQKDPLYIFLSVLFGMVCLFSSSGELLKSWLSFKSQSQTQSRCLASCMPWWSAKQSICSSKQSKPDKSTERLWKGKTVVQVTRDKHMEQQRCQGLWEVGNQTEFEEWQKTLHLDLLNSWQGKPKISAARQKSAREPSSATENLSWDSSLFSETSSYYLGTKQNNLRQQNPAPAFHSPG